MAHCNYYDAYVKGITQPLPELAQTFISEKRYILSLFQELPKNAKVLEVGCGLGRSSSQLAKERSDLIFYGIDYDERMIKGAEKNQPKNITYFQRDAFDTGFPDKFFDCSYSTYNLIGSIPKKNIDSLLLEQKRITKKDIVTIFWNQKKKTTEFLKEYYKFIGVKLTFINEKDFFTNKGTRRPSVREIKEAYRRNGFAVNSIEEVGKLWVAIRGRPYV